MLEAQAGGLIRGYDNKLNFLLGGRARFVLKSLKTEKSFSYSIKKIKNYYAVYSKQKHSGYLGALTFIKGKLRFRPNPMVHAIPAAMAFAWYVENINSLDCELYHQGACSMCGRALSDPESIEKGIGPVCAEKLAEAKHQEELKWIKEHKT